jgi:hypothetical protein
MKAYRLAVAVAATVIAVGSWASVGSGQQQTSNSADLPGSPLSGKGEAIYPAVEGWGPHKDGQNVVLVGYFNRNKEQALDIPVGPNNRIEPGGPDLGQPTHFEPGRHYGVFSLPVPKDGSKKYTWTLIANGQTAVVQLWANPPYWVDLFRNPSTGNTAPVIRFAANGPELTGPPEGIATNLTATVNQPFELKAWVSDKPPTYDPEEGLSAAARNAGRGASAAAARGRGAAAPPNFDISAASGGTVERRGRGTGPQPDVTLSWKLHRGPAPVKLKDATIRLFNKGNTDAVMEANTTATFTVPGEYVLRAQVNDQTGDGGGGDMCCWTDALVKVTVK